MRRPRGDVSREYLLTRGGHFSFFYIDERKANGGPVGSVPDGPGHAKISLSLVEDEEISHYVTFVDGKHTEFP